MASPPCGLASVNWPPSPERGRVRLYDAHAHYQDKRLTPHWPALASELPAQGVTLAMVNGTEPADWAAVESLAAAHAWIRPSFGLHPWKVGNRGADWDAQLHDFLTRHPQAGIGEAGLDRWILQHARADDPRLAGLRRASLEEQGAVLAVQLRRAASDNRAITLHCLQAWEVLLEHLRRSPLPSRGLLLHAYAGPLDKVSAFLDLGAYFSFNGAFLAAKHSAKLEAFRTLPRNRLLVETDAPDLALPEDLRRHTLPATPAGTSVNHPANLAVAYEHLAALRAEPLPLLADYVEENFLRFFGSSGAAATRS